MDEWEMSNTLHGLIKELAEISNKDPDQEVQGIALSVLDAVIGEAKKALPDHPIVKTLEELISPEAVERAEAVRAIDLRLALVPLAYAIDRIVPPPVIA